MKKRKERVSKSSALNYCQGFFIVLVLLCLAGCAGRTIAPQLERIYGWPDNRYDLIRK